MITLLLHLLRLFPFLCGGHRHLALDIVVSPGAHVRCHGKGRKERCTPLRKDAVAVLRSWLRASDA